VRDGLREVRDGLREVRDGLREVRDGLREVRDGRLRCLLRALLPTLRLLTTTTTRVSSFNPALDTKHQQVCREQTRYQQPIPSQSPAITTMAWPIDSAGPDPQYGLRIFMGVPVLHGVPRGYFPRLAVEIHGQPNWCDERYEPSFIETASKEDILRRDLDCEIEGRKNLESHCIRLETQLAEERARKEEEEPRAAKKPRLGTEHGHSQETDDVSQTDCYVGGAAASLVEGDLKSHFPSNNDPSPGPEPTPYDLRVGPIVLKSVLDSGKSMPRWREGTSDTLPNTPNTNAITNDFNGVELRKCKGDTDWSTGESALSNVDRTVPPLKWMLNPEDRPILRWDTPSRTRSRTLESWQSLPKEAVFFKDIKNEDATVAQELKATKSNIGPAWTHYNLTGAQKGRLYIIPWGSKYRESCTDKHPGHCKAHDFWLDLGSRNKILLTDLIPKSITGHASDSRAPQPPMTSKVSEKRTSLSESSGLETSTGLERPSNSTETIADTERPSNPTEVSTERPSSPTETVAHSKSPSSSIERTVGPQKRSSPTEHKEAEKKVKYSHVGLSTNSETAQAPKASPQPISVNRYSTWNTGGLGSRNPFIYDGPSFSSLKRGRKQLRPATEG
jgi:hypothetical protein